MTHVYTIGEVARTAGVNIQTIRYYERRRLLAPTTRKASGYRLYDEEALKRLRFIKNAQEIGFSLNEISDLLNLRVSYICSENGGNLSCHREGFKEPHQDLSS